MTSNRSRTKARADAQATSAETPRDAIVALARHATRIQIAAAATTGSAIAGWAHAVDRLAQAIGDELLRRVDRETDSGELVIRVASATHDHLRELTTLPAAAADHFNARISRASINN